MEEVERPHIQDARDAILRVTASAICGSDLHIYNGLLPQSRPLVLGHEFMGIIEEVGAAVTNLQRGDRVIVPFPVACGRCWFCERGLTIHCERSNPQRYGPEGAATQGKGGGLFGYTDLYGGYPGGQAEYVRVPFADFGPRKVPESVADEQALFLTDIIPTGWAAVEWAQPRGGETYAVFGCGPTGLMAQKAAWIRGAGRVIAVDIVPYRLEMARTAARSEVINAAERDPVDEIRARTQGHGADVCIDAVGLEADRGLFERLSAAVRFQRGTTKVLGACIDAVRRGGHVSIIGVYATDCDGFPLGKAFDKGLTLRLGQAQVHRYVDDLMRLVVDGTLRGDDIITHRFPLEAAPHAYELFNSKQDTCVKVVLRP